MDKKPNIKNELKECEELKEKYLAGWKRAQADFLNYKKEELERKKELTKDVTKYLILKILPILDNLYIAEKQMPADLKDNKWLKGSLQIKNQILDFLKNQGVEQIKAEGEEFNPEFHEAVEIVESENHQTHIIIEEIKKGYIYNNRVIRPSQVKISK